LNFHEKIAKKYTNWPATWTEMTKGKRIENQRDSHAFWLDFAFWWDDTIIQKPGTHVSLTFFIFFVFFNSYLFYSSMINRPHITYIMSPTLPKIFYGQQSREGSCAVLSVSELQKNPIQGILNKKIRLIFLRLLPALWTSK
jgi:hypothetical protein